MMINRRTFVQQSAWGLATLSMAGLPWEEVLGNAKTSVQITILHTNDVHSRIEPFPADGGKYAGLGGVARRMTLLRQIRRETPNVLLFDSGDILQGTPYFNIYGGELEFKLMNEMNYIASTIGNHDFDGGFEQLAKLTDLAKFPMLNCNYDLRQTPLHEKAQPFMIFEQSGIKIGVLGVGVRLEGLIPTELSKAVVYEDPIEKANTVARYLREKQRCDLVVCLSHLGYESRDNNDVNDKILAWKSRNIDVILGGHTHTLLPAPVIERNLDGEEVIINQVGYAGIALGRLDFYLHKGKKKSIFSKNIFLK